MPLKYYGERQTDSETTLRVEIHQASFSGTATSVRLMDSGADIMTSGPGNEHVYKALLPTTAQVYLWDPTGAIDDEIADAEAEEYHVVVKEGAQVVFSGPVVPSPDKRSLNAFPDVATILARCSLADLKDIPFVDDSGDFYAGSMSVKDIVCEVLRKTGLGLNVFTGSNWFVPGLSGTADPLASYFLDMEAFRTADGFPVSCEDVLAGLCDTFHLQVRQSLGAWHCIQRSVLFSGSYRRFEYTPAGTLVGSGMFNPVVSVSEATAALLRTSTDRQPRILAYKGVTVTFDHGPVPPLIRNGNFSLSWREGARAPYPPRRPGRPGTGGDSSGDDPRGGSIGRRSLGRDFGGQYNAPTPEEEQKKYWKNQDGGVDITIESGRAPDGSNTAVLTPVLRPGSFSDITKWYWQEGIRFTGGEGVQIQWSLATFLETFKINWPRRTWQGPFPVYYRIVLSDGASDQYWLAADGSWKSVETNILFGDEAWTRRTGIPPGSRRGISPEVWHTFRNISQDTPAGTWVLKVFLYQAVDNTPDDIPTLYKHHWANVQFNIVRAGVVAPGAQNVTALNSASTNKLTQAVQVRFGDAPVVGMLHALTLADGTSTGNWKVGPYSGEPNTGKSHAQLLAEERFLEQAEHVDVHEAGYLREMPRVWPHQVLELDGVRYQVGDVTYSMARSRQAGSYVRLRRYASSPDVDQRAEEGTFTSVGGYGDAATQAYFEFSDFVHNFATANPLATTSGPIPPKESPPTIIRVS